MPVTCKGAGEPGEIELARVAHALSDPLRIGILDLLAQARCQACSSPIDPDMPEAMCACDLAPQLDDMTPSKLAYHLKILHKAGLIDEQRRGKWVYHTLHTPTIEGFARLVSERFAGASSPGARRCGGRPAAKLRHAGRARV